MADDGAVQAVWNFDAAELLLLFQLKAEFINNLKTWNLDGAYWSVRNLRMETDAKLSRFSGKKLHILEAEIEEAKTNPKEKKKTEKEEVDEQLADLENHRDLYLRERKPTTEMRGTYYMKLEAFYMKLCLLMKIHGIYFREGEDNQLAVLRR